MVVRLISLVEMRPPDQEQPAPPEPIAQSDEASRIERAKARTAELQRQAAARLATERRRRWWVRGLFDFAEHDRRSAAGLLAGGLAYRLFLWLLPLAVVTVAGIGLFADIGGRSPSATAHDLGLGAAVASAVASAVLNSTKSNLVLLFIGVWGVLLAGRVAARSLAIVSELAWEVPRTRTRHGIRQSLAFTGVGLGLIVLQSVSTFLYAGGLLPDLVVHVAMVSIFTAVAIWASRLLPHPPDLTWKDLLPGAIVFGAGSRIMAVVSSVYLAGKLERVDDVYGALGTALVILLWLYLIARIMVAVPMLNSALWRRRQAEAAAAGTDVADGGRADP